MGMLWHWSHKNLLLGRPLCFSTRSWAIGAWGGGAAACFYFGCMAGTSLHGLGEAQQSCTPAHS